MSDDTLAGRGLADGLFRAFNRLALQGFGGVLPVAQRELVERQALAHARAVRRAAVAGQVLPGPNIVNLALIIGDRFFGWRGALAALAGLLLVPLVHRAGLAALSTASFWRAGRWWPARCAAWARWRRAGAGTAFKLAHAARQPAGLGWPAAPSRCSRRWPSAGLRWPLVWVVLGLGCRGLALAWWRLKPMNGLHPVGSTAADWLALFGHFMLLSLLAVGGAITTAPDMHRYVVGRARLAGATRSSPLQSRWRRPRRGRTCCSWR
jgi:chromate transporter